MYVYTNIELFIIILFSIYHSLVKPISFFSSVLADLCFIPNIKNPEKKKPKIALIFMDAYSRLCYTSIVQSTKSSEIASHLKPAEEFYQGTFKKFTSDRGKLFDI